MNLSPLLKSHWVIILHAVAALFAIVLGGLQFLMKKGTAVHRLVGRLWVGIMLLVALSSFAIHEIRIFGPFSYIHILSLLVLHALWEGVTRIRRGDLAGHKRSMIQLYALALILTGAFTLYPGRVMYRVFFGT